jgi:putative transposase
MEYSYESPTVFKIQYHFDFVTKYRYQILTLKIITSRPLKIRETERLGAPSYLMKYLGLLSPNIHSHTAHCLINCV